MPGTRKLVFTITGLVLVLILVITIISNFWPTQEKWFFELGLLGKNKIADDYFADSSSIIGVGDLNTWFIYIHNHMGKVYNVSIRVKLLNFSMKLPDDRKNQPSEASSFTELPLSLSTNETVLVPFSWSINEIEYPQGLVIIKSLLVNEQKIDVYVPALDDSSFRIVFELWIQDQNSGEYLFGWKSGKDVLSASIYMGFEIE